GRRDGGDLAPAVVGLVRAGEPDDTLGEMREVLTRGDDGVSQHVVVVRRTGGPRPAQIQHLNRRGPRGEHFHAVVLIEALQIDGNVEPLFAHRRYHLRRRAMGNVDEAIEGGRYSLPHRPLVGRSIGDADDLEPRSIVQLYELADEV